MSEYERPGVYSSYQLSGVLSSGKSAGTAAVAALADSGAEGEVYDITSYAGAVSLFGGESDITELIGILMKNGVSEIKASPVLSGTAAKYAAAFKALCAVEDVSIIVTGSGDAETVAALSAAISSASERCGHKIGVAECRGTVSEAAAAAESVNSERIVLVKPAGIGSEGLAAGGTAAAVAGAVLAASDPAIPLNGAELYGLEAVEGRFSDGDVNILIRGGVTPVERTGSSVCAVRGVTTRTRTGGAADSTWRELTTVRIIDDVIPTVRDVLRSMFSRTKNTAQTRGAIRTQVVIELEKKLAAEIIDGYDNVSVTQNSGDPTVCDVSFEFTVAHGLNQIRLTAYITV